MIESAEHLLDQYAAGRISRRDAARALVGLAIAPLGVAAKLGAAPAGEPTFRATGLNHLGLRVTDVARSRDFYRQHLGMGVIRDNGPGNCFLSSGDHYLGLFRSTSPAVDHFAYTIEGYDADRAQEALARVGLRSRRADDRVYFDDPDGLEIQLDSPFGSWPGPRPAATR